MLQVSNQAEGEPASAMINSKGIKSDLADLMITILSGKWAIITSMLVALAAGVIYIQMSTKIYTAFAQVILDTRQHSPTENEQVVSNMEVSASVVAGEVVSMRSNVLIGRVVDSLKLVENPEFRPADQAVAAAMTPQELRSYATSVVWRQLDVRQAGISYAILISFSSTDPGMAARVANEVVRQYILDQVELKRTATLQATTFLQGRIEELAAQIEKAEQEVVAYREWLLVEVGADQDATEQILTALNEEFVSLAAERTATESRFEAVQSLFDSQGIEALRDVIDSPLLNSLMSEHATVASERARLATSLGRLHPDLVRIEAQLRDLERSIEAEVSKQLEVLRSEVAVAKNRERVLMSRMAETEARRAEFQRASVRLGQLERAAEAARLVYEDFLERFTEMNAQVEFQAPEARLIGEATVPKAPSAPRKTYILAAAGALGVAVGLAWVFLSAAIRRPVTSTHELENLTGLPVLASLPYISDRLWFWPFRRERLHKETIERFTERVRTLRARLFVGRGASKNRVLMVTSAMPGEGKSTLCLALANTLQNVGRSVVVIDADLRRSHSKKDLNLSDMGACLVEYLSSEYPPSLALVQKAEAFEIPIVAPMRRSDNAADLITSKSFEVLIEYMAEKFEVVIIDCPPIISLADTQQIAQHAQAAILLVKNRSTRDRLIVAALRHLHDTGVLVAGTVLSQVRRSESRSDELYSYYYE